MVNSDDVMVKRNAINTRKYRCQSYSYTYSYSKHKLSDDRERVRVRVRGKYLKFVTLGKNVIYR